MEKINKRLLAIIPYFGGDSSAAPSKVELRPLYLKKCIQSIRSQPVKKITILVYVTNKKDFNLVKSLKCEPIMIPEIEHPKFLPYEAVTETQELLAKLNGKNSYILVTEADQMWTINWDLAQERLYGNNYFSPLRLEEIYKTQGSARGQNVALQGSTWAIINSDGLNYPHHRNKINTFGGGFLCTHDAFMNIHFQKSDALPVEHITGFSPFACLKCEMGTGTYVLHLSGYEYHQKLAGVKNENIHCSRSI
jgi:hypothetical protein